MHGLHFVTFAEHESESTVTLTIGAPSSVVNPFSNDVASWNTQLAAFATRGADFTTPKEMMMIGPTYSMPGLPHVAVPVALPLGSIALTGSPPA
jgi:hypothetical protein